MDDINVIDMNCSVWQKKYSHFIKENMFGVRRRACGRPQMYLFKFLYMKQCLLSGHMASNSPVDEYNRRWSSLGIFMLVPYSFGFVIIDSVRSCDG